MADKSKRGGARNGAGRKADDGATNLVISSYKLTHGQKAFVAERGGSSYMRHLIEMARKALQ